MEITVLLLMTYCRNHYVLVFTNRYKTFTKVVTGIKFSKVLAWQYFQITWSSSTVLQSNITGSKLQLVSKYFTTVLESWAFEFGSLHPVMPHSTSSGSGRKDNCQLSMEWWTYDKEGIDKMPCIFFAGVMLSYGLCRWCSIIAHANWYFVAIQDWSY